MPEETPLDDRIRTAGQLVIRARIYYDLWYFYAEHENRQTIIETMREYSEFFRFDEYAHRFTFVVLMATLFDHDKKTISFPNLLRDIKKDGTISSEDTAIIDSLINTARPLVKKVAILRNKAYAHRNAEISVDEAHIQAGVTPNQFRELTEIALQIVNQLLKARKLKEAFFWKLHLKDARRMLNVLSEHSQIT